LCSDRPHRYTAQDNCNHRKDPMTPSNTLLTLTYRDAGNFKRQLEEVVRGAISASQVERLSRKFESGYMLIAEQLGLPTPSFEEMPGEEDWPSEELDHVYTSWAQFEDADGAPALSTLLTDRPPTLAMTIDELVARTEAVRRWNVSDEWDRMEQSARRIDGPSVKRI